MDYIASTKGSIAVNEMNPGLYSKWLAYNQVSAKSADTYKKAIMAFAKWLSNEGVTAPEREDIINYRNYLVTTYKPTTAQVYLVAVRLFFSWLEQEGIYKDVAKRIKGVKLDKEHKKDFLSADQAHTVLESIERKSLKGKRNYAIVALMLTTGLRTIEISRADVKDLRTSGADTMLYVQGKGHTEKGAAVKVAPVVERAIREYLAERNATEEEPLFTSESNNSTGCRMTTRSISGIAKAALISAGFNSEMLTAHSFRHTAGTLALLNGASLEQVQQMLRHTNINTTMIYMHGIERARNNSELKVADAIF